MSGRPDLPALLAGIGAHVDGERDAIANAANLAAFVYESFPDLNWAGFYFVRDGELVLGPFVGKTAVSRIGLGVGVCGAAWERAETLVVPDVHAFPGHIACDAESRSEIVIPLFRAGVVVGVLDCDSPIGDRFDDADRVALEALAAAYVAASDPV